MDHSEAILQEILQSEFDAQMERESRPAATPPAAAPDSSEEKRKGDGDSHTQWALGGNGRFIPVGSTAPRLPAGIYEPFATPGAWGLERLKIESDGIYRLPDMATEMVLDEVSRFWDSEQRYRKHGLLYKRGLILFGPAGSGKTATIKLLMSDLVDRDGIVIVVRNAPLAVECLKAIRRIEPNRNLINVFEDIDEIIDYNGESTILSMLDGENNIDRVLNLATTNHPERLGARIINRPSRFDRRIFVGMPSPAARELYLRKATGGALADEEITKWVADTHELSVAHLRELVAAVYCLDQSYDDVIERLHEMAKQIKVDDEFKRGRLGFGKSSSSNRLALVDTGFTSGGA